MERINKYLDRIKEREKRFPHRKEASKSTSNRTPDKNCNPLDTLRDIQLILENSPDGKECLQREDQLKLLAEKTDDFIIANLLFELKNKSIDVRNEKAINCTNGYKFITDNRITLLKELDQTLNEHVIDEYLDNVLADLTDLNAELEKYSIDWRLFNICNVNENFDFIFDKLMESADELCTCIDSLIAQNKIQEQNEKTSRRFSTPLKVTTSVGIIAAVVVVLFFNRKPFF